MNFNIVFQTIKSTPDGKLSTTGKQMEKAFNGNFELIKQTFNSLLSILATTVHSEQIKQIRVDTSTTPATIYYTLDDESVTDPTWVKLLDLSFAQITGDPMQNIALKNILNSKASAEDVKVLQQSQLTSTDDISTMKSDISTLQSTTGSQGVAINNIQAQIPEFVKTTNGLLYLKYNSADNTLEYSNDNASWHNINEASADWDNLTGNITDNTELVNYVTNEINKAVSECAPLSTFNAHVQDYTNPHQVTKEQVGLGDVENYSSEDMPLSRAAKERFEAAEARIVDFEVSSLEAFKIKGNNNAVEEKVYIISSHDSPIGGV